LVLCWAASDDVLAFVDPLLHSSVAGPGVGWAADVRGQVGLQRGGTARLPAAWLETAVEEYTPTLWIMGYAPTPWIMGFTVPFLLGMGWESTWFVCMDEVLGLHGGCGMLEDGDWHMCCVRTGVYANWHVSWHQSIVCQLTVCHTSVSCQQYQLSISKHHVRDTATLDYCISTGRSCHTTL
jgi:hypothetical protein